MDIQGTVEGVRLFSKPAILHTLVSEKVISILRDGEEIE